LIISKSLFTHKLGHLGEEELQSKFSPTGIITVLAISTVAAIPPVFQPPDDDHRNLNNDCSGCDQNEEYFHNGP
jgi:hypothetical protein